MVELTTIKDQYPFESYWLDLGGQAYHYLDEGPRDAPPLVLLHGNPTWSFYYRTLIPALSQKYRVIVPDHIGCGLSAKPQSYPYTLAQHIQNLEILISTLDLSRINLGLHDWGGAIGMGYATRHPENVASLTVFNTAAFFVPRVPKRIRLCRIPWLGEVLVRGLNGFVLAALVFATSQHRRFFQARAEVAQGYLAPYHNWQSRIAIHRFIQDIPLESDHPSRRTLDEIEAGLSQLARHPMLIMWGADDFCFTQTHFLPEWRKRFPQAHVQVIRKAGHYVVEDAHEQIIPAMLGFLEKVYRESKV